MMKFEKALRAGSIFLLSLSAAYAQDASVITVPAPPPPQAQVGGAGGMRSGLAGYVPSAAPGGMVTGGSNTVQAAQSGAQPAAVVTVSPDGTQVIQNQTIAAPVNPAVPPLDNGTEMTPEKAEGFNEALRQQAPMTPEMIRHWKAIMEAQQRALLERPAPQTITDAGMLSLEPGETPPVIHVATGMFTAISVYDNTGQPWPITQYVIGDGKSFQVVQLGENSNGVTVTPLVPVGWTNMALILKDEPTPVIIELRVSASVANARRDIQIMKSGPNALVNTISEMPIIRPINMPQEEPILREAGSPLLMAALTGADLPDTAKPLGVSGVSAQVWMIGDRLLVRTRAALTSPSWSNSMAGPNGIRVYEIPVVSVALFSVDGQIQTANIAIP